MHGENHTHTVLVNQGLMNIIDAYGRFLGTNTQYSHFPIQPAPTWKERKQKSDEQTQILKNIACLRKLNMSRVHYCSQWQKKEKIDTKLQAVQCSYWRKRKNMFFFCVPQKVLRFLGIVHDRARGPWEQHTQASETPQDLNKTKHIQLQYNRAYFLLHICYTIVLNSKGVLLLQCLCLVVKMMLCLFNVLILKILQSTWSELLDKPQAFVLLLQSKQTWITSCCLPFAKWIIGGKIAYYIICVWWINMLFIYQKPDNIFV